MLDKVKVLIAGNWRWDYYEEALARGFTALGCDVIRFNTLDCGAPDGTGLLDRIRPEFVLRDVNKKFINSVLREKPDILFAWRCIDIFPNSYRLIKDALPATKIILYHNDNPYFRAKTKFQCRRYLASHPLADIVAVYRPDNILKARAYGARRVELLLSSFIRERHRPITKQQVRDLTFIGHFESDGRDRLLDIIHRSGVNVSIFGPEWDRVSKKYEWIHKLGVKPVYGDEYSKTISESKISICFLSRRQNDVYTRRCFEIPACGSLLLAPRTDFLKTCFIEGTEAEFWGNETELVHKVQMLLNDEQRRSRIASTGRMRILQDGHDEYARAKEILSWFKEDHCNKRTILSTESVVAHPKRNYIALKVY